MPENVSGVVKFYRDVIAPFEISTTPQGEVVRTIRPLTRMNFLTGPGLAVMFLVHRVALSFIFLVANIFTCFQRETLKQPLYECLQEIPVYLKAIPLGYFGFFYPQTVNERALGIPANGLWIASWRRSQFRSF